MAYYAESIKRGPNHRGRPRLVTVLGNLPGAVGHGFDGDGTPNGATVRLWEFAEVLLGPLSDGVTKLTAAAFNKAVADREAAKPEPLPEPPPRVPRLTDTEIEQLRALLPTLQSHGEVGGG